MKRWQSVAALGLLAFLLTGGLAGQAAQDSTTARPAFEVDQTWPRLPNNWVIGDPSSIAVDRHDNEIGRASCRERV